MLVLRQYVIKVDPYNETTACMNFLCTKQYVIIEYLWLSIVDFCIKNRFIVITVPM